MTSLISVMAAAVPIGVVGMGASIVLLLYGVLTMPRFRPGPMHVGGLMVAGAALVSSAVSHEWSAGTVHVVLLGTFLVLAPNVSDHLARVVGRGRLSVGLAIGSALFVLTELVGSYHILGLTPAGAFGMLGSHNWVGAICGLSLVATPTTPRGGRRARALWLTFAALMLLGIVVAHSWVASLGVVSGFIARMIFAKRRLIGAAVISGIVVAAGLFVGLTWVPATVGEAVHVGALPLRDASLAAHDRLRIFADAAAHVLRHPFLGPGSLNMVQLHAHGETLGYLLTKPIHYHNGVAQLAVGYGLIAAVGLLYSLTSYGLGPGQVSSGAVAVTVTYLVMDSLDLLSIAPVNILVIFYLFVAATKDTGGDNGRFAGHLHALTRRLALMVVCVVAVSLSSAFVPKQRPASAQAAELVAPTAVRSQEADYAFARIRFGNAPSTLVLLYCRNVCHVAAKGITHPVNRTSSQWFGKVGFVSLPAGTYQILLVAIPGKNPHPWSQTTELATQELRVRPGAP